MSVSYDVVVVGAGIHGAGLAQAAAAAGHSVLVLEQSAIAAGSSSRSSKLIHGGLRYLESAQFHLVRESLHERTLMLKLAPELVHLRRFYIPVYRATRRRPWQLRLGLTLYALLAGFARGSRFGTLPRNRWGELDGINAHQLQCVFWYHDAQTNDALLTAAVMRSAQSLGAELQLPARFVAAELRDQDCVVRYRQGDAEHEVQCRVLINAAGPWADDIAQQIAPGISVPMLQRVRGTHIVLPTSFGEHCYYMESPRDGRAVFALPWQGQLMIGTTEARYSGDPGEVQPTGGEINYLLGIGKHYFPHLRCYEPQDVVRSFAGLRVLPGGPGHAFHRSRETLLICDRKETPRVLSIYGGKLTTWRAVSERALQRVAGALPRRTARASTRELPLSPT
ncbi:MAG: FAD-dependent oxidoreductase [Steroidobacteraceae bacterium]